MKLSAFWLLQNRFTRSMEVMNTIQGADTSRIKCVCQKRICTTTSRWTDRLAMIHPKAKHDVSRSCLLIFFALLVQPPISPTAGGPTSSAGRAVADVGGSFNLQARQPALRMEEHLDCRGQRNGVGLGFSMGFGESPQKIWSVGCETSNGK